MTPKRLLDRLVVLLQPHRTVTIIHLHHMVRLLTMVPIIHLMDHLTARPDLIFLTAHLLRPLDSVESRRVLLSVTCCSTCDRRS